MRTPVFVAASCAAVVLCVAGRAPAGQPDAVAAPANTMLSVAELAEQIDAAQAAAREGKRGPDLEMILAELVGRGGPEVEKLLSSKSKEARSELRRLRKQVTSWEDPELPEKWHDWVDALDRVGAEDLLLLTALCRVQNKPDPLIVRVRFPDRLTATTRELPVLHVALRSRRIDRMPVYIQQGGNYRSGRQTRWRVEVRDSAGEALPVRPADEFGWTGGGISVHGFLEFGKTWKTSLPMGDYVRIPEPGEYTVTVLYHDTIEIADVGDRDRLKDLLVFSSSPFQLTVSKAPWTVIKLQAGSREKARELIRRLDEHGPVKLVRGPYDESFHDFLPPESAPGGLLTMGWQAAPEMLDSLADEQASSRKRAWLLSLLYTISGAEDLDPALASHGRVLGEYESRSGGGWVSVSTELDPAAQRKLVSAWLEFKEQYLDIRAGGENGSRP